MRRRGAAADGCGRAAVLAQSVLRLCDAVAPRARHTMEVTMVAFTRPLTRPTGYPAFGGARRRARGGGGRLGDHDGVVRGGAEEAEGAREVRGRLPLLVLAPELLPVPEERGGELLAQLRVLREELVRGLRERGGPDVRAAVRAAAVREPRRGRFEGYSVQNTSSK